MSLNRKCYVYKFIDMNNRVMYVGETNNINRRIAQHITKKSGKFNNKTLNQIQKIEYINVDDKVTARQFEIYYINKYKPYLNISDKFKSVKVSRNEYYERDWKIYRIYRDSNVKLTSKQNQLGYLCTYIMFIGILLMFFIKNL